MEYAESAGSEVYEVYEVYEKNLQILVYIDAEENSKS
jgi:hypothetical protein